MSIWSVAKIAATKIPWGRVFENLPVVVEMANRAKGRFMGEGAGAASELEARVQQLHEENRKLEKALLETSGHLQLAVKTLKVVLARQKVLMAATAVSLVVAIAALVVALN
ncbi:MAG: hypothetical protein FPO08_10855 [Geobacter sp.]|nr:MAG: hypothetical protein FPO08_10855 [Geobacter sp.]